MTESAEQKPTTVGNYFISNYPPFSCWTPEGVAALDEVFARPAPEGVPLGLYVHLPFCRKRCDFCYFKVYTDKNGAQVRRYVDAVLREAESYAAAPYIAGRSPQFVYFGGGTPSYLSTELLRILFDGLRERLPWDGVEELAFEAEPGTLQEGKAKLLAELGVTRLSFGVENFDPEILELNNRAHRAVEIDRAYGWARAAGFPQINIDLIAGMVGETEDNWWRCVERVIEMDAESVTIYQMEVPYNTELYQRMKADGSPAPVADWDTKRRWVDGAFARLEEVGYHVGSAYTAYKGEGTAFLYRDALWQGADMIGLGVSSFGHLGGVHYQNEHSFEPCVARAEAGERPVYRALALSDDERLIREFILQLKLGHLDPAGFRAKFGVDVLERFAEPLRQHAADGWLTVGADGIRLSRAGLLRVDTLLPAFFLEEHRGTRYA